MLIFDWSKEINSDELKQVVQALNENKIVIFPTETVYGIGGNALNEQVVEKLYQAKKREARKPISVLVKNKIAIKDIAYVSDSEAKIIDAFMPGPLTLVLKKRDNISSVLTAGSDTVGVRIPKNKIALSILDRLNYPLATSSANISGMTNSAGFAKLITEFKNDVAIFIKGDVSSDLQASTVAIVDNGKVNILREGKITLSDLQEVIKWVIYTGKYNYNII